MSTAEATQRLSQLLPRTSNNMRIDNLHNNVTTRRPLASSGSSDINNNNMQEDPQRFISPCSSASSFSPVSPQHTATTMSLSPPESPLPCDENMGSVILTPSPRELLKPPLIKTPIDTRFSSKHNQPPDLLSSTAPLRILIAFVGLLGTPFLLYNGFPASTVIGNLHVMKTVWDGLLKMSCIPPAILALVISVYYGPTCVAQCRGTCGSDTMCVDSQRLATRLARCTGLKRKTTRSFLRRAKSFLNSVDGIAVVLIFAFGTPPAIFGSMPMIAPSWLWYPLAWSDYKVSRASELGSALEGLCVDQTAREIHLPTKSWKPTFLQTEISPEERRRLPLCLEEDSWQTLSAGALSSYNRNDVQRVLKGVEYARDQSGGLVIAVLARDVADHLEAFRENVESLRRFFPNKLSVVIFENDSSDGSREAIKEWSSLVSGADRGYMVDLMECPGVVDCKLGKQHRDEDTGSYAKSKAVGEMDVYRNRVKDYITESPLYEGYSHMMVLDIDLAVSLSPLGLLHSLGQHPDTAVASSGRQIYAASLGTISFPYDLSAFRPWATEKNAHVLSFHEMWCGLMPLGDRWRNSCDAPSPFLTMEMLRADRGYTDDDSSSDDFYRVQSAFNGAVLYPLEEIREDDPQYDAGEDGQRCEHLGFNLGLKRPMYVNRKWDFHIDPVNPGGPTGWRAQNAITHVTTNLKLLSAFAIMQVLVFGIFIHSITTLGICLVYPLMAPLLSGSNSIRRLIRSNQRRRMQKAGRKTASDEEAFYKLV